MDYAITYLQTAIQQAKQKVNRSLEAQNVEVMIRESDKVTNVLEIMNFCSDECHLPFGKQSITLQTNSEEMNQR